MSLITIGILFGLAYLAVGVILDILQYFHTPRLFRPQGWELVYEPVPRIVLWPLVVISMVLEIRNGRSPWGSMYVANVTADPAIQEGLGRLKEGKWPR